MISVYLYIVLIGVGTARLTALFTRDSIFQPLREFLFTFFPPENDARLGLWYQNMMKATPGERERNLNMAKWYRRRYIETEDPVRGHTFLGELLACPYCLSVWLGFANYVLSTHWAHWGFTINAMLSVSYIGAVGVHKGGWR